MGLTCKIKYGFNAGLAIDDVIAMDPDVGEAVGEGSEITVTVNRRAELLMVILTAIITFIIYNT